MARSRTSWAKIALLLLLAVGAAVWSSSLSRMLWQEADRMCDTAHRSALPVVWQTFRTYDLPPRVQFYRDHVIKLNPDYIVRLLDDDAVRKWVKDHYHSSVLQIFDSLPLGVMRADLWRYMVLYHEGGIYLDADVEMYVPVSKWRELKQGCKVLIGVETLANTNEQDTGLFSNWAIVSLEPRHPLLGSIVERSLKLAQTGVDTSNDRFVHEVTGPRMMTEAIFDFFEPAGAPRDVRRFLRWWAHARPTTAFGDGVCFGKDQKMFGSESGYLSNQYLSQWIDDYRLTAKGNHAASWIHERRAKVDGVAVHHGRDPWRKGAAIHGIHGKKSPVTYDMS